jgi:uncharacterized membrane protein
MATYDMIAPVETAALPVIRKIGVADLTDCLRKGVSDFLAMPTHVIFLCVIYPIVGLLAGRLAFGYELLPLLFPLAAGFALLGPFAAIGLYELSRRREAGLETSWRHAFDVIHSPSLPSILMIAALLLVLFGIWIAVAHAIYVSHFGWREPASLTGFIRDVLTTRAGQSMMVIGNGVGFLFAVAAMAVSAISFPLLLDRNVGAAAAIATSVGVVLKNPVTMAVWGLIVALSLAAGFAALMVGLVVVLPILGHATWHLYRRAVEPATGPRPPIEVKERGRRHAADFPASLFSSSRK